MIHEGKLNGALNRFFFLPRFSFASSFFLPALRPILLASCKHTGIDYQNHERSVFLSLSLPVCPPVCLPVLLSPSPLPPSFADILSPRDIHPNFRRCIPSVHDPRGSSEDSLSPVVREGEPSPLKIRNPRSKVGRREQPKLEVFKH